MGLLTKRIHNVPLAIFTIVTVIILNTINLGVSREAEAAYIKKFNLIAINGTVDPVIYTDEDGTFTTSEITITLNPLNTSTVSIDTLTGFISDRVYMDVSFNNGKPGALNENFMGTIVLEESGQLLPPSDPFCQQFPQPFTECADLIINSGTLTGAGPFNQTKVKGNNPTWLPSEPPPEPPLPTKCEDKNGGITILGWRFSPPDSTPHIFIDLPSPPFIGGENIVVHGEIIGCMAMIPTVISLIAFNATAYDNEILLEWTTGAEINNEGFNILRSESEQGPYTKLNGILIPAKGIAPGGASYEFTDTSVENDKTYFYKLEDVDTDGTKTEHGPIKITATKKSDFSGFVGGCGFIKHRGNIRPPSNGQIAGIFLPFFSILALILIRSLWRFQRSVRG